MSSLIPEEAARWSIEHLSNAYAAPPYQPFGARDVCSAAEQAAAIGILAKVPGYAPTPLTSLPKLAIDCGLASMHVKDEGSRFGLGSFKPLGTTLAVLHALSRKIGQELEGDVVSADAAVTELLREGSAARAIASRCTLVCASDGNYGVALSWAATLFGAKALVVVPSTASAGRCAAIEAQGGRVERQDGTFDELVHRCSESAERNEGYVLVQDVAWPGYETIPRVVLRGHAVLAGEIIEACRRQGGEGEAEEQRRSLLLPTHIFVNCGVGKLVCYLFSKPAMGLRSRRVSECARAAGCFAAAVCSHLWERLGSDRPRFVVAEPCAADCLFRSGAAGRPTNAPGDLDTIQVGLACGCPSSIAWRVLKEGANDFVRVPDEAVAPCMRLLAKGDPSVVAGESAVAGLAAVVAAARQPKLRSALGLTDESRVVVVVCEGATDPVLYAKLIAEE